MQASCQTALCGIDARLPAAALQGTPLGFLLRTDKSGIFHPAATAKLPRPIPVNGIEAGIRLFKREPSCRDFARLAPRAVRLLLTRRDTWLAVLRMSEWPLPSWRDLSILLGLGRAPAEVEKSYSN